MIKMPTHHPRPGIDQSGGKQGFFPVRRHHHFHRHNHGGITRRQFIQTGAAALGVAAGAGFFPRRALAARRGTGFPRQLEGASPILSSPANFGIPIPFFLPVEIDPFTGDPAAVFDPSTFADFNGFIGVVEADGVGDPSENADGVARRWACDVRFMHGVFVDRQGRKQAGSFAFF